MALARSRAIALALACALALADASVVTLALPELLTQLDTGVEGVAAVLGVYTAVLAVLLIPAWWAVRALGPRWVGTLGMLIFGAASIGCGVADTLESLLIFRGVQAVGGAALLIAGFALLTTGQAADFGRKLWPLAAIVGTATGPALGGALTWAFDWRAIFLVQAPFALAGALACLFAPRAEARRAAAVEGAPASAPLEEGDSEPMPGADDAPATPSAKARRGSRGRLWTDDDETRELDPAGDTAKLEPARAGDTQKLESARGNVVRGDSKRVVKRAFPIVPAISLALLSAALTAVLFLLVLLLIAGWSFEPLAAAAAVSVIPVGAFIGSRVHGEAKARAAAGSFLVGGGIIALAFLPEAELGWTLLPSAAAGFGMGLALTALSGTLLPEREPGEAASLLAIRHAGIALALLVLAPIASADLTEATDTAQLRGISIVLDADLPPGDKLELAPDLLKGVEAEDPRDGLQKALDEQRPKFSGDESFVFDQIARRADDTLVLAVAEAFETPFLLTGALALLGGILLLPRAGHRGALLGAAACAAIIPAGYAYLHKDLAPEAVEIQDPCNAERDSPDSPGLEGLLQKGGLILLDRAACDLGSSREELVLALADEDERKAFEKYGKDPRQASSLITSILRG